jgi:CRP/FNR family cyclic AMP-dependent transcriptional regulator
MIPATPLSGAACPATWVATGPGRGLTLSATRFAELLREQPRVREHVLRYLAVQACQSRAALPAGAAGPAATRVARWLLAASGPGHRKVIGLPAGQQGLAEELGLSRVTVNRALRQFAATGVIRVRPRQIILLAPAGLTPPPP